MLIFYVRHGDPIYDPDQLTPLGKRQAESVAKRLAMYGIDEIYSSTSTRAMETAQPLCEYLNKELTALDWMNEARAWDEMTIDWGQNYRTWCWSHPRSANILMRRDVREMGDRWYEHPELKEYDLGVCPKRVGKELDDWLLGFGLEHDREKSLYKLNDDVKDKRIAIFAHEGFGKVFLSELLDIPFPYVATHLDMKHTGVTVITFDEGIKFDYEGYARARVLTFSNDSHLYRDGLPVTHISTHIKENY